MKIEPVFDGELIIGKFYQVPTVYGPLGPRFDDYPVLGPKHDDRQIIGFPNDHYHYDYRFFNRDQWEFALRWSRGGYVHGAVMSETDQTKLGPIVFRRRRCQRQYPDFPVYIAEQGWLPKLQAAYASAIMTNLTCPHRGASLRGLAVDEAGCVTCPLHGLRWDLKTGRLA